MNKPRGPRTPPVDIAVPSGGAFPLWKPGDPVEVSLQQKLMLHLQRQTTRLNELDQICTDLDSQVSAYKEAYAKATGRIRELEAEVLEYLAKLKGADTKGKVVKLRPEEPSEEVKRLAAAGALLNPKK